MRFRTFGRNLNFGQIWTSAQAISIQKITILLILAIQQIFMATDSLVKNLLLKIKLIINQQNEIRSLRF